MEIGVYKKAFFQTSISFLVHRIFSTHFLCMLSIWKTILRIQEISGYNLEHHTTRRNDYTTGEINFCRILENEAMKNVKYVSITPKICLMRPLRESQKIFQTSNKKSGPTKSCALFWRSKKIYTTWPYDKNWLRDLLQSEKKAKCASRVPF